MKPKWMWTLAVSAAITGAVSGQSSQRNATIVNGGAADHGKCTIEVVVDSAAEVEIRGATATLRTVSGQAAQWRRFECTSALPANPPNFAFNGVDGRGRQSLTRDPRNGGVAVVRIEDPSGGSEGYTFDLMWDSRGQSYSGGNNNAPGNRDDHGPNYAENDRNRQANDRQGNDRQGNDGQYRPNYRDSDYYRRNNRGFGTQEAIQVCQAEVSRQASRQFRGSDIRFEDTRIDDSPSRQDWLTGMIDVNRRGRDERYRFSCSVDFDRGTVRSARLESRPVPRSR